MNARTEFEEHIGERTVKCVDIIICTHKENKYLNIKVDHTDIDYGKFLCLLDIDYCEGYGSQQLYGIIWYEDGTWSERAEYGGTEWWEYKSLPSIPKELL